MDVFAWIFIFFLGVKIVQIVPALVAVSPSSWLTCPCVGSFHCVVWYHCPCFVSSISFLSGTFSRLLLYVSCPSCVDSPFHKGKGIRSRVWKALNVLVASRLCLGLGPLSQQRMSTCVQISINDSGGSTVVDIDLSWVQADVSSWCCLHTDSSTPLTILPQPGGLPATNCRLHWWFRNCVFAHSSQGCSSEPPRGGGSSVSYRQSVCGLPCCSCALLSHNPLIYKATKLSTPFLFSYWCVWRPSLGIHWHVFKLPDQLTRSSHEPI